MNAEYQERVQFVMVYIREAHASDEWAMGSNTRAGIDYAQPQTDQERALVARQFVEHFQPGFPVVVDSADDRVNKIYGGWPDRLYVIDGDGLIAFQGKVGPFGFKPQKAQETILELLEASS